jgi:hypothetical protein
VTAVLPSPADLPDPPGSPGPLLAALERLTAAAFSAGALRHVLEPAAVLQGWQGADAAVTGAEVLTATSVADQLHEALAEALHRLSVHADSWQLAERRVADLRLQQQRQFEAAASRLAGWSDPLAMGPTTVPPEAVALVRDVVADESARVAEHRALLADLADDAARTAAVLGAVGGRFGGTGRSGQQAQVAVHLAAVLPGWGTGAMAGLGAGAARVLTAQGAVTEPAAAAARYAPYAGVPAFAVALVGGLGTDGLRHLLSVLAVTASGAGAGESQPLAGLLAGVLTAAGTSDPRVEYVLGHERDAAKAPAGAWGSGAAAPLMDPLDPDVAVDAVAVAMGLVLAAPGAGPALAATWGRHMLERERAQGASAVARTASSASPDPVHAALGALVRAGDASAAADFLATPEVWAAALARSWPDEGEALARVIELAGPDPAGGQASWAALQALGEGLQPGTTRTVTGEPQTLASVREAVGGLVAAQIEQVVAALEPVSTGAVPTAAADAGLRGLARLLLQPGQDEIVTGVLADALRADAAGGSAPEVAGAFVAVQEYAERVRHALACAQGLVDAVERQVWFDVAVQLPTFAPREVLGKVAPQVGDLADAAVDVLAWASGSEGTYVPPEDTGPVRTEEDAARFAALTGPHTGGQAAVDAWAAAARSGYARTSAVLGVPPVPSAPGPTLLDRVQPPDPRDDPRPGWRPSRPR